MKEIVKDNEYRELLNKISSSFLKARQNAFKAINQELIISNWETGKHIVEFEQKGRVKAEYGRNLIAELAKDLTKSSGKGFSRSNLVYMRLFYLKYPKGVTPSHLLTWSHYYELLKINYPEAEPSRY